MRVLRAAVLVFALASAAFAADLKVKVVDPQSAAVAGAQVTLSSDCALDSVERASTSSVGVALVGLRIEHPPASNCPLHLQVLAPGFAPHSEDVVGDHTDFVTIHLSLAAASETVVVTATRTPLPAEQSGSSISTLENNQLEAMQPISAADAIRFLPGAVLSNAGQRGGLTTLFVRGGDSVYNKVLVDGVPLNEPGGTFDFGVVPLAGADRIEFLRGAQSTLYGSDAMTSVVQVFSRTGSTATPELRFGADGGNFNTAHGFAALSGARGIWDYNFFADQFNTQGLGVNDLYSNSLQGGNAGVGIAGKTFFRVRVRHSNSRTGIPGEWNFNGQPLLAPDIDARARQNNFLASADLDFTSGSHWQHKLSGFEYNHKRLNEDTVPDRGCDPATFNFFDCFF